MITLATLKTAARLVNTRPRLVTRPADRCGTETGTRLITHQLEAASAIFPVLKRRKHAHNADGRGISASRQWLSHNTGTFLAQSFLSRDHIDV